MNKGIILLAFLLLTVLVSCSNPQLDNPHIAKILPNKKSDIPPSIRKCMTVKCSAGYYCFFGRCIPNDTLCQAKKCKKGQRCVKGQCVQQLHKPKKNICSPLYFKLKKQKCTKELRELCRNQLPPINVCGFNKNNGKYHDYNSPCLACADNICQIDFYYQASCDAAPRICDQDQQCLNGVCSAIFVNPAFQNCKTCNLKDNCYRNEVCAGHKCIERRDLYNFMQAISETDAIYVKI